MKYSIKQLEGKSFSDKMDLVRAIKSNYSLIHAMKKAEYKTKSSPLISSDIVSKQFEPLIEDIKGDFIEVESIINTTNVIDSHMDLHTKSTWNKTVKDNPYSTHLKSHKADFEYVMSSRAENYNKQMNFKDIGLSIDFPMVANLNKFVLERKTLPLMFDKYINGEVKEHSVGMMYVNLDLAYYDEDSEKNMDYFEKAKAQAINPEVADEYGYVWLVSEAKKREGSAVVFGSNSLTPTLSVKNYEPSKGTRNKNAAEKSLQLNQFFNNLNF